jgi:chromosome segregation protein
MYLSRLDIFGFKSFAQRVNLTFDSGMTAIVGPNGCGKTNIVDAIRWVLGEQKSSTLRSDKMEDVIFNGTDRRKPIGMAEAILTIQNTKGILPTEYTEVTIGRRLFRSGESEYLLNGTICRLKDIIDLFMDTGMGANAYSVIELKMVETILSDKTDERRRLFEEAAGVTRYKYRRKEAYRRLEQVQQDLTRVNDIIKEVQKTVNSLERQAKKAEEYNHISEMLRKLEVDLIEHEYSAVHGQHTVLAEKLKIAVDDKNKIDEELSRREALLDVLREEMSEVESSLSQTLRDYNSVRDDMHRVEEDKIRATERIRTLQETIRRYEHENVAGLNQSSRIEQSKAKLHENIARAVTEIAGLADEIAQKQKDLNGFSEMVEEKKISLRTEQDTIVDLVRKIGENRSGQERSKARIDNINGRLERADEENHHYRQEISEIDKKISFLTSDHKQFRQQFVEAEVKLYRSENYKKSVQEEIEKLRAESYEIKNTAERIKTRIQFLKGLIESNDGVAEGVQFLLHDKSWSDTPESVATLGESIRVDSSYRIAIESVLGEAVGYIISSNREQAVRAISYLKKMGKGKATFICIDRILQTAEESAPSQESDSMPDGAIGYARNLIGGPPEIQRVIRMLLDDILIVESLEAAERIIGNGDATDCVTPEGERFSKYGFIKGGSARADEGRSLGKKQQLEVLSVELASLDDKKNDIEILLVEKSALARSIDQKTERDEVKSLEKRIASIEIRIAQLQFEKKRAEEAIERNETESYEFKKEIDTLQEVLKKYQPELDNLENRRSESQKRVGVLGEEVEQLEKEYARRSQAYNQLSVKHIEKMNVKSKLEREIEFADSNLADIATGIQHRTDEIKISTGELKRLREVIEITTEKSDALRREIATIEDKRSEIEKRHTSKRDEIQNIVHAIKDERRLREDSVSITHELEMKVNELTLKLSTMKERAREELDIDLKLESYPDDDPFDIPGAREQIHEIKNRLRKLSGVNFAAFEEYEKETERLKFLQSQSDDLQEAEKTLIETIDEINTTAQEKFLGTFNQIRENFIKTFKSLFEEGDECDLRLISDSGRDGSPNLFDPLEARIEIIAKPRGKRPTSISLLSGGEKTLTAIALLFAIYLVKPSPFCILDEVDAPLDDSNIDRFTNMLHQFSDNTQFIVVTHNKRTMEAAGALYGVTMEEKGVSKLVSVRFNQSTAAVN